MPLFFCCCLCQCIFACFGFITLPCPQSTHPTTKVKLARGSNNLYISHTALRRAHKPSIFQARPTHHGIQGAKCSVFLLKRDCAVAPGRLLIFTRVRHLKVFAHGDNQPQSAATEGQAAVAAKSVTNQCLRRRG